MSPPTAAGLPVGGRPQDRGAAPRGGAAADHADGRGPTEFRSTAAEQKRIDPVVHGNEGRFDCQRDEYAYLYLAETQAAVFAEAFLRDDVVQDPGARFLRRDKVTRAALSRIELTAAVTLVDLRGAAGLTRIGQDSWLTSSEEVDYPLTQLWAAAIRRWAPGADGLCWMAKRDNLPLCRDAVR